MSIKSIEVAKALEQTFTDRGISTLKGQRPGIERFPYGENHVFLVLDLALSRQILTMDVFASYNYFREGLERSEKAGRPAANLARFFDEGLLFQEGEQHLSAKYSHRKLLDEQCEQLQRVLPEIVRFFEKRTAWIDDPLTFSRLFVRLCLGITVSALTFAPLTASMRAVRKRENVFYYYFHPLRHQRMDAALVKLNGRGPNGGDRCSETAHLLSQSLVVMGYDPLIASICATLADDESSDFTRAPARCCPTSFVSRICIEETIIGGRHFAPGDIFYVSLVRREADSSIQDTFPFGLGVHSCVGIRFARVVLSLAGKVVEHCFPGGFRQRAVAYEDGAFLSFKIN